MRSEDEWFVIKKGVFIFFVLVLALTIFLYGRYGDHISTNDLREYVNTMGIWAPLGFVVFFTLGTIFIPTTPFMLASGVLFGFYAGLIYSYLGSLLSAILLFYVARHLGKHWVERILVHKYLTKIQEYNGRLENGGFTDMLVWRNIPVIPANALNLIMGVSKIKARNYIWGTALGLIPSIVLTVLAGVILIKIF